MGRMPVKQRRDQRHALGPVAVIVMPHFFFSVMADYKKSAVHDELFAKADMPAQDRIQLQGFKKSVKVTVALEAVIGDPE